MPEETFDILKSVTWDWPEGLEVDVAKAEDDDESWSTSWLLAVEGVPDHHGDVFEPGSFEMLRERGTVTHFEHQLLPAGVFTMSREGTNILAHVKFLKSDAGQATREYLQEMKKSAQFSFRSRSYQGEVFRRAGGGRSFTRARLYETSPVLIGSSNTGLTEAVKGDVAMPPEVQDSLEAPESPTPPNPPAPETPAWATALLKDVDIMKTGLSSLGGRLDTIETSVKPKEPEPEPKPEPKPFDVIKGMFEQLTDVEKQELGIPVRPSVPPAELRPARVNYLGFMEQDGDPIFDTVKSIFNHPQYKDHATPGVHSLNLDLPRHAIDVMKATLVDVGPVYMRDRIRQEVTPVEYVLDMLPMLPVGGNMIQAPVMRQITGLAPGATGGPPLMNAPSTANEIDIDVDVYNYPVQQLTFSHPVARSVFEDDATAMAAEVMRLIKGGRQRLLQQVLGGAATINFTNGTITASGRQLVGIVGSAPFVTVAENTDVLSAPNGIHSLIFALRQRVMPNMVLVHHDVAFDIWESLRRAFYQLNMEGGGMAMPVGARADVVPWLPANQGIVGDFRDDNFYIGMRRDLNIRTSEDREIDEDNVVFVATARCAAVTINPMAFRAMRTTNNYRVEVPLVREQA